MNDHPARSPEAPGDSTAEPIRARYDWASTLPSIAVIETVAIAVNNRPTEMPSLDDRIDPKALDAVFRRGPRSPGDSALRVTFPYAAHEVCVVGHGEVIANPLYASA